MLHVELHGATVPHPVVQDASQPSCVVPWTPVVHVPSPTSSHRCFFVHGTSWVVPSIFAVHLAVAPVHMPPSVGVQLRLSFPVNPQLRHPPLQHPYSMSSTLVLGVGYCASHLFTQSIAP